MARRRRGAPAGGGGARPVAAAAAAADQQQEVKEGTSPVDLTSIRLREDEEERREQEHQVESPDLPTLLDQLEQSLSAAWEDGDDPAAATTAAASPSRSTSRRSSLASRGEPHDSDDDMQQEEARLADSAQKLKRVLDDSTSALQFCDASSGSSSDEERSVVQDDEAGMVDALAGEGKEQEEGEQKSSPASNDGPAYPSSPSSLSSPPPRAASPAQWPSTPTQPPAHPQPPLLQTSSPPPTPSAATPTATSYYDCPGTDGLEEGDDDDDDASGFATPLGSSSAHTLRRSSSAFSLSARSLTGSPLRLASALRGEAAAPQEEEETKGEGARTSSTPPPPTPVDAPDDDDDDGRRDMHEVVCASQRLSEAAIHMRFAGLRAAGASAGGGAAGLIEVENGGVLGAGGDASSSMCRHLAIIALRPDAVAGAVTTALVEVARAQGLLIAKRQGPHVVAEMAPSGPGRWEWAQVDMQLCVDRQARDRVLLVRFLLAPGAGGSEDAPPGAAGPSSSSLSSSHHGGGRGEEEEAAAARRRRPATRAFLEALRRRLVELGLNRHALARLSGCKGLELDPQYLQQLEDLAREDMNRALEAQARALEDYARAAEWRCRQLLGLLQPMFELYKMDPPVLGKPLPLSYYPLDLLGAYEGPRGGSGAGSPRSCEKRVANGDGEVEGSSSISSSSSGEGTHAACPSSSPAGCLAALQARAWGGLVARCDAEMTARLQRKNRQVVDRLGRVSDYERLLVRALRDNRHRLTLPLFKTLREQQAQTQGGEGQGGEEDVETPLFYCSCLVAARPATLYILSSHLVFISRLPGFNYRRRVAFKDVRSASLSTHSRLGFGKLGQAIEIEVPPPPAAPSKSRHGSSRGGGPANDIIAFSSNVEPERLIELIKLLVSIHAEDAKDAEGADEDR